MKTVKTTIKTLAYVTGMVLITPVIILAILAAAAGGVVRWAFSDG